MYIYTCNRIFGVDAAERKTDLALHARVAQLWWVDAASLEAPLDETNTEAMVTFFAAQVCSEPLNIYIYIYIIYYLKINM